MKKIITAISLFIICSQAFNSQALAQNNDDSQKVRTFIHNVGNNIIKTANNSKLSNSERRNEIMKIIDKAINPIWISRFVLGKNYRRTSQENKIKFSKLYREFMNNTYGPKFQNYDGKKFDVVAVTKQRRFYIVKAEFLPKKSDVPIDIAFRVKKKGEKLMILDFIAEGISLIETQRSEFNSAISRKGMDKFLEDLEARVKKLKKNQ